jgi:hypothetical protein
MDFGIKAEVTHQLSGAFEARDVAHRRHESCSRGQIDSRHREQQPDTRLFEGRLGNVGLDPAQLFAQELQLA